MSLATLTDTAVLFAQLVGEDRGEVSGRAQIVAVIGTVLFLVLVLELVRRRKLVERYALLWMGVAIFGVVLAVWNDALNSIAEATGIQSPTNGLFLLGLVAVVAMMLNFSAAISRLSEETKILAQTISRLDAENRELRGEGPRQPAAAGNGAEPAADVEAAAAPPPAEGGEARDD